MLQLAGFYHAASVGGVFHLHASFVACDGRFFQRRGAAYPRRRFPAGISAFLPLAEASWKIAGAALQQFGGDVVQKAAGNGFFVAAVGAAPPTGTREGQPFSGACDAHIEQTPLLCQVFVIIARTAVRQEHLVQTGDEHLVKLQPLGGMER